MRIAKVILVMNVLLLQPGCKKSENLQTPPEQVSPVSASETAARQGSPQGAANVAAQSKPKIDACALLTSSDIESVQREAIKETKLSGSSEGGFSVSQCFYTLPTSTNSISLQVTQRGQGSAARDPREFWTETFHRDRHSEKERERDREKSSKREEDEEESTPPLKVSGVGDEAFWMGSRVGGALYVLKENNYVRISVGGSGSQTDKIQKSKALAQKIVSRL